jgi:glycosidase
MTGADVWWHVYPLGAVGAPIREPDPELAAGEGGVVHRLDRLLPWIGHAASLGCTGIQLGPIFASATHGYDTIDHDRIDPRLGDEDDFRRLVETAHDAGLRVMLDGVFNHVGDVHPFHRQAMADGPGSPADRYLRVDWSNGAGPRAACFEGHSDLILLNHAEPAVADLVAQTMIRWLDAGADAWRLDAAYATDPAFWSLVLPRVRAAHPTVGVIGEVIHGDYAGIVGRSGMDGVTQYELWKAIWSAIKDHNLFELTWAFDRHNRFVEQFSPMTFIGNHDTTRIASQVGDAGAAVALAVLMTVGGTPSVFYGDELGWRGVKEHRRGGDDAVRSALPESTWDLPRATWPVIERHRQLIGLRRRHPWLARARTTVLELTGERLVYQATGSLGSSAGSVEVMIDLRGAPRAEIRADGGTLLVGA